MRRKRATIAPLTALAVLLGPSVAPAPATSSEVPIEPRPDTESSDPADQAPLENSEAVPSAGILFVDQDTHPTVTVSWLDRDGTEHRHTGARPYAIDAERTPLGGNLECYAAVGGTRLAKAAGHPRGAIVRAGFYKAVNAKPFFEGVAPDTLITVELSGVRFNQPVDVHAPSVVQHLKYDRGEMQACGLPGDAREQFNLAGKDETLNSRIQPGVDARQGVLMPIDDSRGTTHLTVEADGSVTMRVSFRYPLLRNLRDPWKSDLPGTFLEPFHFHLEFEALPAGVDPLPPSRPQT